MKQDFHDRYNPDFEQLFMVKKSCKLGYDGTGLYPPNVNKLIEELGISSDLRYEKGIGLNFDHLTKESRNQERPFFIFEEEKMS
jgi:hypothetical protein